MEKAAAEAALNEESRFKDTQPSPGKKRVFFEIDEEDLPIGGIVLVEALSGDGSRRFHSVYIGETNSWSRIGWLEFALLKERQKASEAWGDA